MLYRRRLRSFESAPRGRRPLLHRRRAGCIVRGEHRGVSATFASGVVLRSSSSLSSVARAITAVRSTLGRSGEKEKKEAEIAEENFGVGEEKRTARAKARETYLKSRARSPPGTRVHSDSTRLDSIRLAQRESRSRLRSTSDRDARLARRDLSREFVVPRRA